MSLTEKYSSLMVVLLLVLAFMVRVKAATAVPFLETDETDKLAFLSNISFDRGDLKLPMGDMREEDPLLNAYFLKLSVLLFGESLLGVRFPYILLSALQLLIIYLLVKDALGRNTAILSLSFLVFDQYHIGVTRHALENSLFFFLTSASLLVFIRGLKTKKVKYVYFMGILAGIGFLTYWGMVLLVVVCLLYLIFNKEYRFWFKRKEFYFAGLLALVISSPYLVWNCAHGTPKLINEHIFDLGFSLRSFYLFFGEVFVWFNQYPQRFIWDLGRQEIDFKTHSGSLVFISDISSELPVMHWPLSVFIFIGYLYCKKIKHKDELIKFSLFMFSFVFIATSIIAGARSLLDDHWWAGMTLFPGIILCAHMINIEQEKYKFLRPCIAGLILYFILHTVIFIHLPESQYAVPKQNLYQFYLKRASIYRDNGQIGLAKNRCLWVLTRSKDAPTIATANDILAGLQKIK